MGHGLRTPLHCCHLAAVEPAAYLTDVLRTLAQGYDGERPAEVMPARWRLRASPGSAA